MPLLRRKGKGAGRHPEKIDRQSAWGPLSCLHAPGRKWPLIEAILALALAAGANLILFCLVISVPRDMARSRGREEIAWIVVSLVGSPFLAIFLLWVMGPVDRSDAGAGR